VADLDAFKREPRFAGTQLVLELGRYLVGEAGYFLTRVVSVKQSRGSRIGICDGGMNNHLPASGNFGMVVPRNYSMHKVGGSGPDEKVDLVGPLCTSIDRLARGRVMPRIEEGDLIAVHNSGSYGLTASPVHFISHGLPREIFVDAQGPRDVTRFDAGT
jgi:diaminopimelate decarboxylase